MMERTREHENAKIMKGTQREPHTVCMRAGPSGDGDERGDDEYII